MSIQAQAVKDLGKIMSRDMVPVTFTNPGETVSFVANCFVQHISKRLDPQTEQLVESPVLAVSCSWELFPDDGAGGRHVPEAEWTVELVDGTAETVKAFIYEPAKPDLTLGLYNFLCERYTE